MPSSDLKTLSIPGYQVLQKLGQGAMAQVYLAVQEALERKVALKVMAETLLVDPEFSERFLREAKIVAQLSHPNIVSVYDVGIHNGCHYLSMEYHSGGDLKAKIKHGITLNKALDIVRQIAEALDFAHNEGYVHRDVKPENILFDRNDNAILTDFGIARSGDATAQMTAVGTILGTPKYMSPEQAKGKEVDARSDLYSLGVIFYEMLTGVVPYTAEHPLAVCQMHVSNPIPDLPKEAALFQPVIHACMAKEPVQRISSGKAIVTMLDDLTNFSTSSSPNAGIDGMTLVPIPRGMVERVDFAQVEAHTDVLNHDLEQPFSNRAADSAGGSLKTRRTGLDGHYRHGNTPANKPALQSRLLASVALLVLVVVVVVKLQFDGLKDAGDVQRDLVEKTQTDTQTTQLVNNGAPEKPALDLLRSVSIIAPQTKSLCQSADPYLLGQRYIGENDSLKSGECFSIRIEVGNNADIIVYSHSQDGTFYRLLPNRCNAMGLMGKQYTSGEPIQLPLDKKQRLGVIGLDDKPGREWVYAIGVSGEKAKQSVIKRLSAAVDVCEARSEAGAVGKINVQTAQDEINRLINEHNGEMQWMARSFEHSLL